MRKALNTLLAAILLTVLSAPIAGFADSREHESHSPGVKFRDSDKAKKDSDQDKEDSETDVKSDLEDDAEVDYLFEEEADEVEHRHNQIKEIYENKSGIIIPPVVIKIREKTNPDIYILPVLPPKGVFQPEPDPEPVVGEIEGMVDQPMSFDPYRLEPIPVASLVLTESTPADEFMGTAQILGTGLAVAALGLFGMTGVSAVRARGKKSSNLNSSEQ